MRILPRVLAFSFILFCAFTSVYSQANLVDPALKVIRKISRTGAQQIHYSLAGQAVAQFEISSAGQVVSVVFPRLSAVPLRPEKVNERHLNIHEVYAWREIKELQQVDLDPRAMLESRLDSLPKYFYEVQGSSADQEQLASLAQALLPHSIPIFFHEVFHLRLAQGKRKGQTLLFTLEEMS